MKKFSILIIIGLIILACGGIYAFNQANSLILQGEVEVKTVDLASKVTGRVEKINIKKGDRINKGDILAELDTPEINAKAQQADAALALAMAQQEKAYNGARSEQVAMAKASLDLAQKTYDRLNRLHEEGVIPTQKLDEAHSKYVAAKENYEMLVRGARIEDKMSAVANVKKAQGANKEVESYLKENKIISPINGVITEVTVEEGELVGAGYPIITIIDDNDCWVTFNLREDLLSKIKNGTEFDIIIPAIGKKPVKVKVNYISALGNFATWRATKAKGDFDMKTFEVRAVPVEQVKDLRAGMSAIFDWKKIK
ncbi:HlyD family secretion protein [bacterium]|nr:HlyD family secretion protein [bacterium]